MYSEFQSRYPTGSLVAELLQIHAGNYVVRAVIQVGGVTLATGMAAAATIEQAEDLARARALIVLGIHQPIYQTQAHLMAAENPPPPARLNPASSSHEGTNASGLFADAPPAWELSIPPTSGVAAPETQLDFHPDSYPEPEAASLEMELKPNGRGKRGKLPMSRSAPEPITARSPVPESRAAFAGPIDLSDIIAQTTVELKRLGWNEIQGRGYLQQAYGKRSRQQLTDEELLDFLHYLKAQPSPHEPSF